MKLLFKILRVVFLLWLLTTVVLAAVYWSTVRRIWVYNPIVWPAFYGAPANETEAQSQDIQYLRRFIDYDRSFTDVERTAFSSHLDQMAEDAGQISDASFYLAVAEAAAISGNGHTNASFSPPYRAFNHAGVDFFWFKDGLYVTRALKPHQDVVGARVVAFDGRDTASVAAAVARYTGGSANWRRVNAVRILRSPALMHAAGLTTSADRLRLDVIDAQGNARTVELQSQPTPAGENLPRRRPIDAVRSGPLPDEGNAWSQTLTVAGEAAPLYLRHYDRNFFWTPIDSDGVYLRPKLLLETSKTPILSTFSAVIESAPPTGFRFMVVDLRFSPGGDYTKVIDFAKAAPDRIRDGGRLYIVTGPHTFSAAIVLTALLKHYGGAKALIVGERVGDDEQFWAESGPLPFRLPNSDYVVNFATGYHDWEHGCAGRHPYCFDLNVQHEVSAGPLSPSVELSPTYADYAAGRDLVMDYIMRAQNTQ